MVDKGLDLDEDQLKRALQLIGKEFIKEARKLLNEPDLAENKDLPHTETGTLARSLKARVRKKKGVGMWLSIIADTRYAVSLFAGSIRTTASGNSVKVRGRPLFDVVMDRIKPRIKNIIADEIKIKC